ncbi:Ras-associated and pleckstrin homology domains-containing protein 1 [Larimichthys crocea]|uniref:Uncharacterized protein n=1 Tax=Larimichthys crocea TaxID=215358 RepID=A0ACD3QXF0_LARCR|nr:Ras-associated and pleckstrin homology domains-containing protein 1 [Larimichthys crocea]
MEQVSDDELDHGAEEDSDKEDQDLDKMFGAWLGELDKLTQSLDDGRPQKTMQKPPLRQETNMANFSYRFSMYNINEALNQGDTVDLDALMADLCSIEQELSTISKPNSTSRGQNKGQRAPGGRSASTKHTGTSGGGSSGGSANSSTRASPANTVRGGSSQRPPRRLQHLPGRHHLSAGEGLSQHGRGGTSDLFLFFFLLLLFFLLHHAAAALVGVVRLAGSTGGPARWARSASRRLRPSAPA